MVVLLPNFDGLVMAGGGDPRNVSALNFVWVSEEGRSGSGLTGTSRGRGHPHAAEAPLKSHGVGPPHGRVPTQHRTRGSILTNPRGVILMDTQGLVLGIQ